MNNQIDEQSLADYLKRESEFSQRYQAIDADEVPAELDQAILLRASQTVSTNKVVAVDRLKRWRRLTLPFAMAATLVLSVSIMMRSGDQVPTRVLTTSANKPAAADSTSVEVQLSNRPPAVQAPAVEIAMPIESAPIKSPANAPAKLDTTPSAPAELKREVDATSTLAMAAKKENRSAAIASAATEVSGQLTTSEEKPATPASNAPISDAATQPNRLAAMNQAAVQRKQSDADSLEESVVTGVRAETKPPSFGPHGTSTYATPRQDVSANEYEKELRESNPPIWLDYIRELRKANKSFKANREWKRFVKAYPNYEVASDDIARGQK